MRVKIDRSQADVSFVKSVYIVTRGFPRDLPSHLLAWDRVALVSVFREAKRLLGLVFVFESATRSPV